MTSPPPATILAEHYRVERELGRGGMATVYLCTDIRTDERVAVKVLRPELGNAVTIERFTREVALVSELDHPRIPKVLASGAMGALPFYVMTYVDGEPLRNILRRDGPLAISAAIEIAGQIIEPMAYAHSRGILHRDIKPENILIAGDGVHVLDFGIARAIIESAGERLTATGVAIGTPAYMSPEQALGNRDLDARSDIYALACVIYELLAGVPPFEGPSPAVLMARRFAAPPRPIRLLRPEIPVSIERALVKALAREPEDRWSTAMEFGDALKQNPEAELEPGAKADGADVASGIPDDLLAQLRKSFADHYRVESELSGGGMSRLFLATDIELGRRVVIKILPPELMSPMMLARFKRESEVTARLQHPHILPVISAGVRDGLVHYVMPFIDGESLRARLKREGRLPIPDAARMLREVVDALAYAHKQGIIHRDIKPENILIQDGHAVLADFGIAAALSGGGTEAGDRLTRTGMSLGTVGYMAPEQSLGEKTVDGRADIYAVGVVGFEMFAGAPPFTGATDHQILVAHLTREPERLDDIREDTPPAVSQAIAKALQKDPDNRFQTAGEFRDALELAVTPAPNFTRAFRLRKLRSVNRKWKIGVPLALIVVVASGVWLSRHRGSASPEDTITVAIAPFNAPTAGLELWHEGMVDYLARNLDGAGPLRTVSPTVAIRGFPAITDKQASIALARRTRAQYVIFGNIIGAPGDSVRLRGSLVNMSTGSQFDTTTDGATTEAAADAFTLAVLNSLKKTHRIGAVRESSFGSKSVSALRAFLQGEQFYRRTSWDSAGAAYARAISFDKTFAIALRRAGAVTGWQRSASDSLERSLKLRAGAANHGLSPRDSLLVAADSISAALVTVSFDSLDWSEARRLFATVNAAAARYPDDPEVWYAVGEARYHHGYGSPVHATERESLDAFKRSIALDSAFAPAYVHAIELSFSLDGADSGRQYTRAYLALSPTDNEAQGIAIVDRVARSDASSKLATDSALDRAEPDAVIQAWYAIRRWPDSSQTAMRLLESLGRRPHASPSFVADSTKLWSFLPLQLAFRGRLSEAYLALGDRPWRLFVEISLLGGIPTDTASTVFARWIKDGIPQAYFALAWLGEHRDTAAIKTLIARADSASATGPQSRRRGARYRASSARAYLSLARRDSADALKRLLALQDTLCIACYMDRFTAARLLIARGRPAEAARLLDERLNTLITPVEVWMAAERGRAYSSVGNRAEAFRAYKLVVDAWSPGDPVLQPYVTEAKRQMAKLRAGNAMERPRHEN